jgi:hypothetical protein
MKRLFSFATFVLIVSLCIATMSSAAKHGYHFQSRQLARANEQRALRNIFGKLIDTETNTIYTMDGQKQQGTPQDLAATEPSSNFHEQLACLQACYTCVEDHPNGSRKKAADNCGPMCDCADSCSRISIDQVHTIYGQSSQARGDTNCWWRTYLQTLNNESVSPS